MKRYTLKKTLFMGGISDAHMEPADDGEFYSRADLIAAGVLVPVLNGNRCLLRHATTDYVLADDGHIYQRDDGDWWSLQDRFQFLVGIDMFVQPVRLVKLEDLG